MNRISKYEQDVQKASGRNMNRIQEYELGTKNKES